MTWLSLAFDRPWYLLLLFLLPVVAWMGQKSLTGLGRWRLGAAMLLRLAILTMFVLALADIQLVRITEKIAAYFLLDQSLSLSPAQRQASLGYVASAVSAHGDERIGDLAGVVVFGGEAQIEHPLDATAPVPAVVESAFDSQHTNLAAALRLAKAAFPDGVARRVVIVSDGNQNLGDALEEGRALADAGIGIDVAPLPNLARSDVRVEKVVSPVGARMGVPFDVTIVLDNSQLGRGAGEPVSGRLTVTKRAAEVHRVVADQPITLTPGKNVLTFRETLDEAGFYTYEARFTPDNPAQDQITQNNAASSFTHLRGKGRVLFIVNSESSTEYDHLIARLRAQEVEVTVQPTSALFGSLAELQQYDSVVLANVPRTSGNGADALVQFTDEQIEMLVRNVEQFGAGLVMLGGSDSFGAGGWANTALEEALPVDLQIKNAKVAALGALMLVIDKSGSMSGEKLELSKAAAKAAVQMLGPLDQIGVFAFDSEAEEVVRLQRVGDKPHRIAGMIGRIGSGGGTNMEPAVRKGYAALQQVNASVKHMIILTDGQTEGSGYTQLAAKMRGQNITTTTVAVGADAAKTLLQDIASRGGGKYYQANNPRALPRIFTRETRRVVRPLVYEDAAGIAPQLASQHEILRGIPKDMPPITGFVLTTLKENPLVEAPILASKPGAPNNTILATWNYGLGRTAAFTTDGGQRWAQAWTGWEGYDQLFVQLVRWSMRPLKDDGNFSIATEQKDGKLRVVVTALDANNDFLNGLPLAGELVSQSSTPLVSVPFEQVAPGRYLGEAPLADAGSYLLAIQTDPGRAPLRAGVSVPYSPEFKDQTANEELLISLANMKPQGGKPGEIIRLPDDPRTWSLFAGPNIFRRDLPRGRHLTSIWPLVLLISAGVFLMDVVNRRIVLTTPSAGALGRWFRRGHSADAEKSPTVAIARLKSRKAAVASELYRDLPPEAALAEAAPASENASVANVPTEPFVTEPIAENEMSYSARLLRAKREQQSKQQKPHKS